MEIKVLGNQLTQHGTTVSFFKGLRITFPHKKNANSASETTTHDGSSYVGVGGRTLVVAMGDCIPVRPFNSYIECLAEIRMIWRDKTEDCVLLSLRLFFLPENTPKGRDDHGEDELVAVKDLEAPRSRMVIRAEDFGTWIVDDVEWNWGLEANFYETPLTKVQPSANGIIATSLLSNAKIDFSDIEKEKEKDEVLRSNVTVLSCSRYYRYRAALKRCEHIEDEKTRMQLIQTLSGFAPTRPNTRVMFAKEEIDYPDLESHEMLCPHLAPKLKGRTKGRKKITSRVSECSSPAHSSEFSAESAESNDSDVFDGKRLIKDKSLLNHSRLTRNKSRVDVVPEPITLQSGRVSKQRLVIPPSNKRKLEDGDSDDSDDYYGEYHDKSSNRKRLDPRKVKDENEYDPALIYGATQRLFSMFQMSQNSSKSPEEISFLLRFASFVAERAHSNPKLLLGIKDVDLFSIYNRVQKLGGFNAIADNRVWKNLFEDSSDPNSKNIAQGMTKRKYERILLPFEIFEREMRESYAPKGSELTISPIPKNYKGRRDYQGNPSRRYDISSPAIEIIPLKNGTNGGELTLEQMKEFQQRHDNSNDGMPLPVHVIMRPSNGSSDSNNEIRMHAGGQKENIPMRKPLPDLAFRTDPRATLNHQIKKQKLDILREGGLEVTPISKKAQSDISFSRQPSSHKHIMQPSVSLTSLTPVRAPKVIQSLNMYQPTNQVFKNPKEDVLNAIKGIKTNECLDLTNKKQTSRYDTQFQGQKQNNLPTNQISLEEVRKNYRGSNPDLQITLVKQQQQQQQQQKQQQQQQQQQQLMQQQYERISSASSPSTNIAKASSPSSSASNNRFDVKGHATSSASSSSSLANKKQSSSSSAINQNLPPPLLNSFQSLLDANRKLFSADAPSSSGNDAIMAAASQLQKFQQQGLPLFPFLSGLDITPMRQQSNMPNPGMQMDSSIMSYLSMFQNPLLQGQNFFPNLPPSVDLLKFYNQSSASKDRAPSKN